MLPSPNFETVHFPPPYIVNLYIVFKKDVKTMLVCYESKTKLWPIYADIQVKGLHICI